MMTSARTSVMRTSRQYMVEKAQQYHDEMVELICDTDEDLMMMYLEGEEIPVEDLKKALRKATIDNKLVPVLCGTAYRNKGVQMLLDAIVDYMPAPIDIPPDQGCQSGYRRRG